MVKVEVPFGVPDAAQPESATNTSKAPARPMRVRKRCSERNRSSISNAANMGATTRIGTGGKRGEGGGGATSDVVVKVSVAVEDPPAAGEIDEGAIAQVDLLGWPAQVSVTAEVKPPTEPTVMVAVPFLPLATVNVEGAADTVKSGVTAVTVPVSVTVCAPAPSVIVSVAVSMADTEGV